MPENNRPRDNNDPPNDPVPESSIAKPPQVLLAAAAGGLIGGLIGALIGAGMG